VIFRFLKIFKPPATGGFFIGFPFDIFASDQRLRMDKCRMLLVFIVIVPLLFISCRKKKNICPICLNGGTCILDSCHCPDTYTGSNCEQLLCPPGYEGTNCDVVSKQKFLGYWRVIETDNMVNRTYSYFISIVSDTGIGNVIIQNFTDKYGLNINGIVNRDTLYLPRQKHYRRYIVGVGYISSDTTDGQYGKIAMKYEVQDSSTSKIIDFGLDPSFPNSPSIWHKQ
jgi:hypothetical protein